MIQRAGDEPQGPPGDICGFDEREQQAVEVAQLTAEAFELVRSLREPQVDDVGNEETHDRDSGRHAQRQRHLPRPRRVQQLIQPPCRRRPTEFRGPGGPADGSERPPASCAIPGTARYAISTGSS
jgi:hypothetical protein